MSITKPYHRLWRPVKGYEPGDFYDNDPHPSADYLEDDRFVCQSEMDSFVITAHLIIRDLYELLNYVEPCDANLNTYSHRIYELFLRTATEFESNCKAILRDNGYTRAENICAYFKIADAAKLAEYSIIFERWATHHEFKPFEAWNTPNYTPLSWYQSYNMVKHDRYQNFSEANLKNLMYAVSGLLCILHAQYGDNMSCACFEGISKIQWDQEKVETGTFIIHAPHFDDDEQYDFIWDNIKTGTDPVQNYAF